MYVHGYNCLWLTGYVTDMYIYIQGVPKKPKLLK